VTVVRVLLTGHQGYLGTVMAPVLAAAGHEVVGLDSGLFASCVLGPPPEDPPGLAVDLRDVDLTDLAGFDAVVHLAALSNDPLGSLVPQITYDINQHASTRLAALAKAAGVRRFLYASTCSVYGAAGGDELVGEDAPLRPVTPYAESKVRVEDVLFALADADFCPVSLRNATAFGFSPRLRADIVLNNLVGHAVLSGVVRVLSDGTPWRPLVHAADIAAAFLAALEAPREAVHARAFNVGSARNNVTVAQIAETVTATVPGSRLAITGETGSDLRSYRVDFSTVQRVLPDFRPQWTIEDGARELYHALTRYGLTQEDFDRRYTRLARLADRQAAGEIAPDLRPMRAAVTAVTHRCRGCASSDVVPVVDLGPQPGADHFPPAPTLEDDPRWPLELWLCRACTLVQLGPVEPRLPEPSLAVESATSLAHAEASVRDLVGAYPELSGATVVEFDSHHGGSWLRHLRAAGCRTVADGERAQLVVDVHGLAHEPAIGRSLAERADRLVPGGLLVLEFHHLLPLLVEGQFDTVRHGHWSYLSLGALSRLAAPLGLAVTAVRQVPLFGGSLQVMLRHSDGSTEVVDPSVKAVLEEEAAAGVDDPERLAGLHAAAHRCATALHDHLVEQRNRGRTVLGYGAPSKAPVLLDVSRVGPELLPFTVDAAPGKHGRRIPGCAVPIRPVDELRAARPDVVLILTWDIADEVISQLEADGGWGAEYLVPMPTPRLITP